MSGDFRQHQEWCLKQIARSMSIPSHLLTENRMKLFDVIQKAVEADFKVSFANSAQGMVMHVETMELDSKRRRHSQAVFEVATEEGITGPLDTMVRALKAVKGVKNGTKP